MQENNKNSVDDIKDQHRGSLEIAIENQDALLVSGLSQNTALIKQVNSVGYTPLMYASCYPSVEVVQALIKNGADLNAKDKDSKTALMIAAEYGHLEVVKALLNNGADVNAKAKNFNKTPLMFAAEYGHVEVVKALLNNGADVNALTISGLTALHYAIHKGSFKVVETLIDNRANVNLSVKDGYTPLMTAASEVPCDLDILQILLENNADMNEEQRYCASALSIADGKSVRFKERLPYPAKRPIEMIQAYIEKNKNAQQKERYIQQKEIVLHASLCFAAQNGYLDIVRLLINHPGNLTTPKECTETPLILAIKNNHPEIVKILLEKHTDHDEVQRALEFASADTHRVIHELLTHHLESSSKPAPTEPDVSHPTVSEKENVFPKELQQIFSTELLNSVKQNLLHAVENDNRKYSTYSLKDELSKNAEAANDLLCIAVANGWNDAVCLLLDNGVHARSTGGENKHALLIAAENKNLELWNLLRDRGASVQDCDINDLLYLVTQNQWQNEMRFLVNEGANVNARSRSDKTALMIAAEQNNPDSCQFLLSKGADIHARDTTGNTALMLAVKKGHLDAIRTLISQGSDINAFNVFGESALVLASKKSPKITELLLQHNAQVGHKNKKGLTALQKAILSGNNEVAKFLINNKRHKREDLIDAAFYAIERGSEALFMSIVAEIKIETASKYDLIQKKILQKAKEAMRQNNMDLSGKMLSAFARASNHYSIEYRHSPHELEYRELKQIYQKNLNQQVQNETDMSAQKEPEKSILPSTTTENSDAIIEQIASMRPGMLHMAYIVGDTKQQESLGSLIDLQEMKADVSNLYINTNELRKSEWIFLDAVEKGYLDCVQKFLTTQNDSIKPTKTSIYIALIVSAIKGHSTVMDCLLKAGAQASLKLVFLMLLTGKIATAFILIKSIVNNLSFVSKSSPGQKDRTEPTSSEKTVENERNLNTSKSLADNTDLNNHNSQKTEPHHTTQAAQSDSSRMHSPIDPEASRQAVGDEGNTVTHSTNLGDQHDQQIASSEPALLLGKRKKHDSHDDPNRDSIDPKKIRKN